MLGVFGRYLARETLQSWAAVAGVLTLVILVNRFALYLGEAAAGRISSGITLVLLGLNLIGLMQIVIPVSLFLATMLVLGRLYRDHEMAVATACGLSPGRLYRPFLVLAGVAAVGIAGISLVAAPWAAALGHRIEVRAQREARVSLLVPGRFKPIGNGRSVFYAEQGKADGTLSGVFAELDETNKGRPTVLTGSEGELKINPANGERHLLLEQGYRYSGKPGRSGWTVTRFRRADILIHAGGSAKVGGPVALNRLPSAALWGRDDAPARAEREWRLIQPLTVLVLILIAVPLAQTRPRQGRYARLVPAILVYVLYFNLLGVGQTWVAHGRIPPLPGLWWVPLLFAAGGLMLLWVRHGTRRARRGGRTNAD